VTLITASSSLIRINQNLGPQLEKTAGLTSLIPEKRIKGGQDQKSFCWHVVYYSTISYFSLFIEQNNVFIFFLWRCPHCDVGETSQTWQPFYCRMKLKEE